MWVHAHTVKKPGDLSAAFDAGAWLSFDGLRPNEKSVERMVERMAARGVPTTASDLDGWLWNRGQSPAIKARPRHRTRTPFY